MAALMVPQVLSIIHVTFPAEERGKVFGMFGGIGGLALILGPVLGGSSSTPTSSAGRGARSSW
ncbi:hypothetical protein NKH77_04145 [Streptomyces sp. M19]